METVSIPKEEYEALKRYRAIVRVVETTIHQSDWDDFLPLAGEVAKELWDNNSDEAWNGV